MPTEEGQKSYIDDGSRKKNRTQWELEKLESSSNCDQTSVDKGEGVKLLGI